MKQVTRVRGEVVRYRSHYGEPGGATPVLMIHGIGCSSDAFVPLLRHFGATGEARPAFAADMPGFGNSPGPARALDIEELAAWQRDLIDVLTLPRVHVIGHSMGCQVALALARLAPERVVSVTLVGPTSGDQVESFWRYGFGLIADSVCETLWWNLRLTFMALQMGLLRYVPTLRHMLRDHPIALAQQVQCPVLVLRGVRDLIIQKSMALRLAVALPYGEYVEIPRGAHAVQFTWPADTWAVAGEFVRRSDLGR